MCGRYAAARSAADLAVEFETDPPETRHGRDPSEVGGDFNAAPTKELPVVRERIDEDQQIHRVLDVLRWGLVPSWSKDASGGSRMVNARVESVASKPAYRRALSRRRCLVPADGWYEWGPPRLGEKAKQPYFMTRRDGSPIAFAGLYEAWRPKDSPDEPWLVTFTIITEPSAGALEEIHDRMPYVVPRHRWADWLDPRLTDAAGLLVPATAAEVGELAIRPVSRLVNNVRNNGPELLASEPAP